MQHLGHSEHVDMKVFVWMGGQVAGWVLLAARPITFLRHKFQHNTRCQQDNSRHSYLPQDTHETFGDQCLQPDVLELAVLGCSCGVGTAGEGQPAKAQGCTLSVSLQMTVQQTTQHSPPLSVTIFTHALLLSC